MLGTKSFLPTPRPSIVFELSGSGHAASKPSLQSISCRDWWLAKLLILCNIKRHAVDYLRTGIKVMLGGLNPTEAPLKLWIKIGEVKWSCYELSWTVLGACRSDKMSTNFCLPSTFPWVSYLSALLKNMTMPFTKLNFFAITTILITKLTNVIWRGILLACAPTVCLNQTT